MEGRGCSRSAWVCFILKRPREAIKISASVKNALIVDA